VTTFFPDGTPGGAPGVLGAAVPTPAERRAAGRDLRKTVPRSVHDQWAPGPGRADPVEVLAESNRSRLADLVPLRNRRMLDSVFGFYRGSPLVMALDLATVPPSGLTVQLCGDAHLVNFGVFASPERQLLFDLNDFDETWPGPFEWDVKRLAASVVVAARSVSHSPADARGAALDSVRSYRQWMQRYSEMTHLEVWYAKVDAKDLLDLMDPSERRATKRQLNKALSRDHVAAFSKLTRLVEGRREIIADPPLVTRIDASDTNTVQALPAMVDEYRSTLPADRRALFDQYRLVDMARKVVGVGSVGTRCWILLFQGPNGGPLFLQVKEAQRSVLEIAAAPGDSAHPGRAIHHGERVVRGQRMLQSASDVLLGWSTAPGGEIHYYVRQLWDMKGSADVNGMTPAALRTYAGGCGWALARAHARTGDSAAIAGYLGRTNRFDEAVASFAEAYADQTERDHEAFRRAADLGRFAVAPAG